MLLAGVFIVDVAIIGVADIGVDFNVPVVGSLCFKVAVVENFAILML